MSTTSRGVGRARSYAGLVVLLLLAIALAAVNVYFMNRDNRHARQATGLTTRIQVLSQQAAQLVRQAAEGDASALKQLTDMRGQIDSSVDLLTRGDAKTGMPSYAAQRLTAPSVAALNQNWDLLEGDIGEVLANRDEILSSSKSAATLTDTLRQLRLSMNEVNATVLRQGSVAAGAGTTARRRDVLAQIFASERQVVLGGQMVNAVARILEGGEDVHAAANSLSNDAQLYGRVLDALIHGNASIGIHALQDAGTLQSLAGIQKTWNGLKDPIAALTTATPVLRVARMAGDWAAQDSRNVLANADKLASQVGQLSTQRIFPNPWWTVLGVALAVLFALWLIVVLVRDQRRRLAASSEINRRNQDAILRLLDEMGSLADGDLTVRATVTEDITGAIADSVNYAVEALRSLVTTINETAVHVSSAAQETRATAMGLADAAKHQAQQIDTASAAIRSMAESIDKVSQNSGESAEVAQRSVRIASHGADVVRETIQGMDSIRDQIQETSKRIKRLGESSQEIGSIVELINDIAEQTNILALNAAIQAASAGEAGRGFAVVADEVQRLAERSANATKRIETLVQTIQSDTNEAVSSMEQTTTEVVHGAHLAEDAGTALGDIENVSNNLAELIQAISVAAQQQSHAATDITHTMNLIQEITSQTSLGASQTADSIGNLAQLAHDLRQSVADFKLPDSSSVEES